MTANSLMDRFYPYPSDFQRPTKRQKRNPSPHRSALTVMPSLFANTNSSTQFLSVPQFSSNKGKLQPVSRVHDDVDDFLSSDLELSFASTMSLNSPTRDSSLTPQESPVPMDISPAPTRLYQQASRPAAGRPRAFTSSARLFGRDLSNDRAPTPTQASFNNDAGTSANSKKLQRAALPFEWMTSNDPEASVDRHDNHFGQDAGDAMDIDTSYQEIIVSQDFSSPVPASAATITNFNALFYESQSPARPAPSPSAPTLGKRRSLSPESVSRNQPDASSSPVLPSSPSERKFERISSGPIAGSRATKPVLEGLGLGNPSKRLRRPVFSVGPLSATPSSHSDNRLPSSQESKPVAAMPPARRAFSAMMPANMLNMPDSPSDDSCSFELPDMSSPAQDYTKRQQSKTLRRCDGSDNLRPMLRETPAKEFSPKQAFNENSPNTARWLVPGFGDNESYGKILPCHRVKEDGLMRVTARTVDRLLDGVYDDKLASYHIIDCRFDYEYEGGHIPGALNINTTAAVEEFLLGQNALKPKPSTSGDAAPKTVLIFHCEFSAKRGPTFAKHLRSKDRSMNNHVYPKVHFPEVYVLEGGYCEYFRNSAGRCKPSGGYVRMDDPNHAISRREDLDQFRKAKFGRTKSYAYGDSAPGAAKVLQHQQKQKRNTAPHNGPSDHPLFAAANAARNRRGGLTTLPEDGNTTAHSDEEDTDIGDSPCPPPSKGAGLPFKVKKMGRAPLVRAETCGVIRMAY